MPVIVNMDRRIFLGSAALLGLGAAAAAVWRYWPEQGLFNPYGIIAVNPAKHPHVKYDLALKFIDYVTGPEGQKIIADYLVDGDPVFFIYDK